MPVDLWPVMQHRMESLPREPTLGSVAEDQPRARRLAARPGPRGGRLDRRATSTTGCPGTKVDWGWNWSETRKALDYLFVVRRARRSPAATASSSRSTTCPSGCSRRRSWPRRSRAQFEATKELIRRAARSHGVATARCLADYYRLQLERGAEARRRRRLAIDELVEDGELLPVTIEGWHRPAYLHRDAELPRKVGRPRAAEPVRPGRVGARAHRAPLRLPLPHRDLRARAEAAVRLLRAAVPARRPDRRPGRPQGRPEGGALLVKAAYAEPGAPAETAYELAEELRDLARGSSSTRSRCTTRGIWRQPCAMAIMSRC